MESSLTTMIPEVFESRKRKILADLSIPDAEYTDLSPKGSVDEGIRILINDINTLPGLVTTSSCAGRISVFLEGRKKQQQQQAVSDEQQQQQRQFVPSGGKGAGKWLYVSHEPLQEYGKVREKEQERQPLHELFGMMPGDGRPPGLNKDGQAPRLVRFSFEPMVRPSLPLFGTLLVPTTLAFCHDSCHVRVCSVSLISQPPVCPVSYGGLRSIQNSTYLVHQCSSTDKLFQQILHIMTATLHHAHPVLSAASTSGFRESGLQSLRCLEANDIEGPSPIVAVRSAGLSLESVIGYCEETDDDNDDNGEPIIRSLVTEEFLEMLVAISNERFAVNSERKERFRANLLDLCSTDHTKSKGKSKPPGWEDPEKRRERMRAEGLKRKQLAQNQRKEVDADLDLSGASLE
ncbi:COG1590 daomin protein [Aspergillus niger]|uniref:tRNA(Phe) 7-[(3-amino-3-carboxypropyl)-4-demethylwyosine(37)-N(4)]-methyltransferase n=1 Tax=Aspergillus niger TaxID=5061 RepID=A0A100IQS1_ASPNG|nr:COG1590 daomin protein [Aspergillus niger]